MKKGLLMILLLTFFLYSKEAYAITDIMAKVESWLKEVEDVKNQAEAFAKKVQDEYIKARQGFNSVDNCFSNPSKCGEAFIDATIAVKGVRAVGKELQSGDLVNKSPKKLADSIRKDGTYKKGQGDDIKRRNIKEKENNAVVTDNIAILFAKGIVTHQSIRLEDKDLYEVTFDNNNMDEILYAQSRIAMNSKRRIAHILELRSYMYNAEALKELMQYNRENDEE